MEGRMELVGHSTAAEKTTADCVRFDRIVTATINRRQGYGRQAGAWPSRQPAPPKDAIMYINFQPLHCSLFTYFLHPTPK